VRFASRSWKSSGAVQIVGPNSRVSQKTGFEANPALSCSSETAQEIRARHYADHHSLVVDDRSAVDLLLDEQAMGVE
jgi:hypothetical protein